jgi:cis-3-alkyl-4-acyloxetan-2-one decarboxylase
VAVPLLSSHKNSISSVEISVPSAAPRTGFEAEYPFASRSLEIDGLRYHYIDEGAGEPLLMVHGNPTWSFAWRKMIAGLKGNSRTLAVDHIGCGFSEKPRDYPYTLRRHVDNLCRFVESLDLRDITLFGHDWGGCIGMGAAVRLPERFRRFVLFNTAAFRSRRIPLRIAVCRIPLLGAIGVRGLNLFSRAALRMAVVDRSRMTPAVRAGYLAPYDGWNNRIAVHRFVQDIPLKPSHPSYDTLVEIENGLEQFRDRPMLFVWGERDWCFTRAFLEEFQRRFPQAETLRLPDAGHYVFEDAPERILPRVRDFLKTDPPNPT